MSLPVHYLLPPSLETTVFRVTIGVFVALMVLLVGLIGWALFLRFRRQRKRGRQRELEARWRPVLSDILDGRQPLEALHRAVESGEEQNVLTFLHRRASEVTPAQLSVLRAAANPYLDTDAVLEKRRSAEKRAYQVHRVGWLGGPEVEPVLRRALDDPSPFVAMVAARALIRRRPAETTAQAERADRIVAALPRFADWSQRSLAALLAQMDGIAPPLRRVFADPEVERRVRLIAAAALREIGDPAAAPIAVELLQQTDAPMPLRTASLRLLEAVGDETHAPFLRKLSQSDNEVIRIRALSALAHIGRAVDVERFEQALNDPSRWVARQAALGLVRLGQPAALLHMIEADHPRAALAHQALAHHRIAA